MKSTHLWLTLALALPLAACPADDDDDTGANTDVTASGSESGTTAPTTTVATTTPGDSSDTLPGTESGSDTTPVDSSGSDSDTTGELSCHFTCAADGDCTVNGIDAGYVCTDSTCTPSNPPPTCTDDAECIAQVSGWGLVPCTMGGGECDVTMQVCVELPDGSGGCAYPAEGGAFTCDTIMQAEVMAVSLDDGSDVTVCGNENGYCDADTSYCGVHCVDDTICGMLTCNVGSGVCECATDDQCTAFGDGATCVDAACHIPACTGDADCTNPFDGGTATCE